MALSNRALSPALRLVARPFTEGGLLRRTAVWSLTGATVTAAFLGVISIALLSATRGSSDSEGLTSGAEGEESSVAADDGRQTRADLSKHE